MLKNVGKWLLMTSSVGLLLAGCQNEGESQSAESGQEGEAETTEITFWHSMGGSVGEALDNLVEEYNESQDQVLVNAQYQGEYDDSLTKIRSSASGSNLGADLVQVFELGTTFMKDSGMIVPVQEYIDQDDEFNIDDLEPNLAAYYTIDDQLYSMPFNSSTPLMYYNKDIFDEAGVEVPESLEEIGAIAEDLESAGAQMPAAVGVYGWYIEQWFSKMEEDMYNNNDGRDGQATEVVFDNNGGMQKILDTWKDLNDQEVLPSVGRGDAGGAEFSSGDAAITLQSTAGLREILDQVGDRFEVGTAYFPKVTEDDQGGVSIGGASLWMIDSEDQEKMDATWDFIKFLTSPEVQAQWNADTGYFPVVTTAHDEEVFQQNIEEFPQFETAIDQLHDSSPEDQGALTGTSQENRQIYETQVERLLNGEISVEEAINEMASQVNQALEDYDPATAE